jgi:hypothetical protein
MTHADRLPPPHPSFAAHFTNPIYDADAAENDDILPFGTDEGFDTVWDWADRIAELQADPRLDVVLGVDARHIAAEAREDDEAADALIAAGFTLLRYTGAIGPADRRILAQVVRRQAERHSDDVYDIMERDLDQLPGPSPTKPTKKRVKPWLVFGSQNDKRLERWLRRIAKAVITDPTWADWWSTSTAEQVVLLPAPVGPPGGMLQIKT